MTNIGTIKDHKVLEDVLLRDIRRQLKGSSAEMEDKDTINYDKTKSGEYALDRPPKKPRREEVDDINTATTITCDTSPDHDNSGNTITDMLGRMKVPNIVRMKMETNQDKKGPLPWDDLIGNRFGLPY